MIVPVPFLILWGVTLSGVIVLLLLQTLKLEKYNRTLFDRLLQITTGYGLSPEPATPELTPETKKEIRSKVDELADHAPFGGFPTFSQLLNAAEAETFKQDADNVLGEEVVRDAELINAKEASDEDDRERVLATRKKFQQSLAQVMGEYRSKTPPVESRG